MDAQEVKKQRELTVVKSNMLIQKSRYSLTPLQFDLLTYVLSGIKKTDEPGQIYNFTIKDFCRVVGLNDRNGAYKRVKDALDAIDKVSIWIPINGTEIRVRWFNDLQMMPNSGQVQLSFFKEIEKHLIGNKRNFTLYEAEQSYSLKKCKYSKYLFDYLKSVEFMGVVTVKLEDFNKYYCPNNFKEFKSINQWILKPAIEEINIMTDIQVEYEPLKINSKKTTHIKFYIKPVTAYEERGKRKLNRCKALDGNNSYSLEDEWL